MLSRMKRLTIDAAVWRELWLLLLLWIITVVANHVRH